MDDNLDDKEFMRIIELKEKEDIGLKRRFHGTKLLSNCYVYHKKMVYLRNSFTY